MGGMNKIAEQAIEEYRDRVAQGDTIDTVIFHLYEDGLTILDSIKAIRTLYGISLGDAKHHVSGHPIWAEVARTHEPLHEKLRELIAIPSYGTWLELYRFGFAKRGMLSVSPPLTLQREIKARLNHAIKVGEETQQNLVQELASFPEEDVLQVLLSILDECDKPLVELAVQIICEMGYPRNARAIPWLVDYVSGLLSPGRHRAILALDAMDQDAVVPFFIAVLLNRNERDSEWSDAVDGICDVLKRRAKWALACAPTVAYLLAQHDDKPDHGPNRGSLLSVLESIVPACAYAIPAIYAVALREGENEVGKQARHLLGLFDEAILKPYQYRLEWLSA